MGDLIELSGVQHPAAMADAPPGASTNSKLDQASRDELIVMLKQSGCSFRKIATVVGVTKAVAHRVYLRFLDGQADLDTVRFRRAMVADLMLAIENLRSVVHDDEIPVPKDAMDHFIRLNKALAMLLGLEEPKKTTMNHDITMTSDNPQAAEFVADLAAWIKKHGAISVPGNVRPPLPPGMTERAKVEPSTNGHGHQGPHGQGMWSMVLAYPRED